MAEEKIEKGVISEEALGEIAGGLNISKETLKKTVIGAGVAVLGTVGLGAGGYSLYKWGEKKGKCEGYNQGIKKGKCEGYNQGIKKGYQCGTAGDEMKINDNGEIQIINTNPFMDY